MLCPINWTSEEKVMPCRDLRTPIYLLRLASYELIKDFRTHHPFISLIWNVLFIEVCLANKKSYNF